MKSPQVSLIIVTYNSDNYIKKCLESVLNCDYPELEILIVDNNSSDSTVKIVDSFGEKIKVIKSGENLGYAAGNNLAIKKTKGKYIFLLNPDTLVDRNFLQPLINKLESNSKIGACQSLVYLMKDKKSINLSGKVTHFLGFDWLRDYQGKKVPQGGEINSFSGSGVLLKKSVLDKIGLFDPLYFMYYEDSDLSWRMRLFGYKIQFVPQSVIYHDYKYIPDKNYQSLKRKLYYNERNRLITVIKNYSLRTLLLIFPALLFVEIAMLFYALLNGWFWEKIKGYVFIISNLGQVLKERKFIQQYRTISDKQISKEFQTGLRFTYFQIWPVKIIINPLLTFYRLIVKNFI